jgi:hypothetical protein
LRIRLTVTGVLLSSALSAAGELFAFDLQIRGKRSLRSEWVDTE